MKFPAMVLLAALGCLASVPQSRASSARTELGTSAAVDQDGRLWIAYAEHSGGGSHVLLRRSDDSGATWLTPVHVTASPEPVSADGENRPKLVFGRKGEMYVSWTSPTSAQFTGDIRFARSLDGGRHWSAPAVVHHDRQLITHRFESLLVDGAGRIWAAWIDKRDLKQAQADKREYAGAAIYYAYSDDQGASWRGDFKLADHTCECCRIALARDDAGRAVAMWRHVFPPNERDHAIALLDPKGSVSVQRATFDRWRIDACPHHGPSLAFAAGARHAVWFNQIDGQGRAFYGRLGDSNPTDVQTLPAGASHADVAAVGDRVAVVWKRYDGDVTKVESRISIDGGRHFSSGPTLQSATDSDQPRLVSTKDSILLVWRHGDGVSVQDLSVPAHADSPIQPSAKSEQAAATLRSFARNTLKDIEREYRGQSFWLVLWDLECAYCVQSLRNLAAAQRTDPDVRIVTITTDPISAAAQIRERLTALGVRSDAYAFSDDSTDALRYSIDPAWAGEKPRAYHYTATRPRQPFTGVLTPAQLSGDTKTL
jgi:hypothetical protein